MGVVAKDGGGGDYKDPPTGLAPSLCIDVVDLGVMKTPFKNDDGTDKYAHQIQIIWQLEAEWENGERALRDDGKPFRVSKFYTLSLNERANLRKDLDSWRGKPFTDEELVEGFDVENLLHKQCNLNMVAKKKQGSDKLKVVVDTVLPKNRKDPVIVIDSTYVREKDKDGGRDTRSPNSTAPSIKGEKKPKERETVPPTEEDDDDLPF